GCTPGFGEHFWRFRNGSAFYHHRTRDAPGHDSQRISADRGFIPYVDGCQRRSDIPASIIISGATNFKFWLICKMPVSLPNINRCQSWLYGIKWRDGLDVVKIF